MKKIGAWWILIITIVVPIAFFSCIGESADDLLDEYEKLIDDIIEFSHSSADFDPIKALAAAEKFQKRLEILSEKLSYYEDDMTTEQTERFIRITLKMSALESF
jgi:hypothetical protein